VTVEHFIYIPGVAMIALTIGYMLGARAARAVVARAKKRLKE
jgi:proteasome assembly chaperone (PAC2) family protein